MSIEGAEEWCDGREGEFLEETINPPEGSGESAIVPNTIQRRYRQPRLVRIDLPGMDIKRGRLTPLGGFPKGATNYSEWELA
jgi:hypothetical protein